MNVIEVRNISKTYENDGVSYQALKPVTFDITQGESVAVCGPSGSGKSTLLHVLGCLHKPSTGQYQLNGVSVEKMSELQLAAIRRKHIGFVFQDFYLLSRTSVFDNVALPLVYSRVPNTKRKKMVTDILEKTQIAPLAQKMSNKLSGGERQRVAISRALVLQPKILMADEPTGNLDTTTGRAILDLFLQIQTQGTTLIVVTHDLELAEKMDRTIMIIDGNIIEDRRNSEPQAPSGSTP